MKEREIIHYYGGDTVLDRKGSRRRSEATNSLVANRQMRVQREEGAY